MGERVSASEGDFESERRWRDDGDVRRGPARRRRRRASSDRARGQPTSIAFACYFLLLVAASGARETGREGITTNIRECIRKKDEQKRTLQI